MENNEMRFVLVVNGKKVFSSVSPSTFETYCRKRYDQLRLCDEHTISFICLSIQEYINRFGPVELPLPVREGYV